MTNSAGQAVNKLEAEIVVIGAGGAGLAAAITVAATKARVILLEKRANPGGSSIMAEGLFAAESPLQKRLGIDARRDALFNTALDYSHWKIDPLILRTFIDKSGDTIRWLEEQGLQFHLEPLFPNQNPLVFHCLKRGGAEVIELFTKSCQESGVTVLYETAAREILKNSDGKVAGVLAVRNAEEITISAGSVIIATGGYGGNSQFLKQYCASYNENMLLRGVPNMGDGLVMAIEAGAATEGLGILQISGPNFRGSPLVGSLAREPNTLWVNKQGERFTNEALTFYNPETANAIDRQPDKITWTLFDEQIRQFLTNKGTFIKRSRVPSFIAEDLENDIKKEAARERLKIAGSWSEIAGYIGVVPKALEATVAEYNSCCQQGYDKVFTKDPRYLVALNKPPYYAIKCGLAFLGTIGGIKINHCMEVLNQQYEPIPGLFAAGVDTGGWESYTYCSLLSGSTFGFAVNSGRIAAENAVSYSREK